MVDVTSCLDESMEGCVVVFDARCIKNLDIVSDESFEFEFCRILTVQIRTRKWYQ